MSKKESDLKRKYWKCILYLDSLPDRWTNYLDELGVPMLLSPLHDRDMDDGGNVKKAHYHLLMEFDGPTPYSQALELVSPLGVNLLKQSISRKRDERYWCHLDSPGKAYYDPADLVCFGGYSPKFLEDEYAADGISAIHDLVEDLGMIYYADLANEIVERHPDLLTCFLRYPAHFNNFMYSRERMASHDNNTYVKSRRRLGRYGG